ncbi:protein phosphatase 2C 51-like isoform X2 [Macadamia integrifolia]|uniref:protein phosphatase 2C 51-like isoform X2 n=1 Tax=Macadamia integrifolia TaxID=60698 RepID=UPI001C501D2D|nr:protein phosphatase 2C 51-like isoform X2 [Macadamia integrifolia]
MLVAVENQEKAMTSPDSGIEDVSEMTRTMQVQRKSLEGRQVKSFCDNKDDGECVKTRKRKHLRKKLSPAVSSRSLELKKEGSSENLGSDESLSPQSLSSSSSSLSDQSSENEGVAVGILEASSEVFGREEVIRSFPCLSHGFASVCGRRREMEDAVTVVPGLLTGKSVWYDFFGVYDGHGGSLVANACRDRLHRVLVKEIEGREALDGTAWKEGDDEFDWKEVMGRCFAKMDEEFKGSGVDEEDDSALERTIGSTAVVAVVGTEELVVANCGDSRAVLSRGGVAVPLSRDHKPDRPDEMERVEAAGGRVINWNGNRVLGVLATSRSIEPEVTVNKRTEADEFLILASDGLWDVMSNEVACEIVRRCFDGQMMKRFSKMGKGLRGGGAGEAAAVLAELAMARGSRDNISVVVVELRKLSNNGFS